MERKQLFEQHSIVNLRDELHTDQTGKTLTAMACLYTGASRY
jgi:hypothetical protein